jgi:uncharacterized protein (DUF488 family)
VEKHHLYSIGHGRRPAEEFLRLLEENAIEYLIDVRTTPYSRFNPQYNKNVLQNFLESHAIKYLHMGEQLGGRPKDPDCYDDKGHVDYSVLAKQAYFLEGIERLKTAFHKKIKLAIMCSESKPQECHRCLLIGKVLQEQNIPIIHIDEKGNPKTQDEASPFKNTTSYNDAIYKR